MRRSFVLSLSLELVFPDFIRRRVRAKGERTDRKDNPRRGLRVPGRSLQAGRLPHPHQARHRSNPAPQAGGDRGNDRLLLAHVQAENQAERLPGTSTIKPFSSSMMFRRNRLERSVANKLERSVYGQLDIAMQG